MKAQRSLRARALQWLSQREQSRSELRRKLLPHAAAEVAAEAEAAEAATSAATATASPRADTATASSTTPAARVEAVLDWLESHNFLSQERFVESRVHARASRFGNLRIRQELKQHQVTLSDEVAQCLRDSELERARAVLERKFATPPANATERAKQARFLAARGFTPEVVARALRRDGAEQHATFDG